jgi:hypothetical protein
MRWTACPSAASSPDSRRKKGDDPPWRKRNERFDAEVDRIAFPSDSNGQDRLFQKPVKTINGQD